MNSEPSSDKERIARRAQEILKTRQSARESLKPFTQYTKPDYDSQWFHDVIFSEVDRLLNDPGVDRLMLFAPPGYGKSEIISRRLPSFVHGRLPGTRLIHCCHTQEFAEEISGEVKGIMESDQYRKLFSDVRVGETKRGEKNTARYFHVINEKEKTTGFHLCAGVGNPITGRRFDLGIIDDVFKDSEQAYSPVNRERIRRWYATTFRTRVAPGAKILIIMTRWHQDDLAGWLLDQQKKKGGEKWRVIEFPVLSEEFPHPYDKRTEKDMPLWPERYPLSEILGAKATMIPVEFSAVYQQKPIPEGGTHFNVRKFGYFDLVTGDQGEQLLCMEKPEGVTTVKLRDCSIYATADMATSVKKSSDPTASGVFAVTPENDVCILDVLNERIAIDDIPARLVAFVSPWEVDFLAVESDAFQLAVVNLIRTRPGAPPVRPVSHRSKSKLSRATKAIVRVAGGQVYLRKGKEWVTEIVSQCARFTGLEDSLDDLVDMLSYGINLMPRGGDPGKDVPPPEKAEVPEDDFDVFEYTDADRRGISGRVRAEGYTPNRRICPPSRFGIPRSERWR